jgi:hypothetical protein
VVHLGFPSQPGYYWGIEQGTTNGALSLTFGFGNRIMLHSPGLTGQAGTISF